jgi:hypothetical protein
MYGFVYIWFDKKHKRFYVGSHKGSFEDGYICSSSWMKRSYKRRPTDFKRKILSIVLTDRQDLLSEEQRYLNMIKDVELGKKYFNLKKNAYGGFTSEAKVAQALYLKERVISEKTKLKTSLALKGVPWSEKRRLSQNGTYKNRLRIKYGDMIFNSKQEAMDYANISRATLDRWCVTKEEWNKFYVD